MYIKAPLIVHRRRAVGVEEGKRERERERESIKKRTKKKQKERKERILLHVYACEDEKEE